MLLNRLDGSVRFPQVSDRDFPNWNEFLIRDPDSLVSKFQDFPGLMDPSSAPEASMDSTVVLTSPIDPESLFASQHPVSLSDGDAPLTDEEDEEEGSSTDEEIAFDLARASDHTQRALSAQKQSRRLYGSSSVDWSICPSPQSTVPSSPDLVSSVSEIPDVAICGRRGYCFLEGVSIPITCKLDTGALLSALSAQDITYFRRRGHRMVRFRLVHHRTLNRSYQLTCKLERTIKVKDINSKRLEFSQRPVVVLNCCLGDPPPEDDPENRGRGRGWKKIEFSLVDREHFVHGMLIGVYAMRQFGVAVCPMKQFDYAMTSIGTRRLGRKMRRDARKRKAQGRRGRRGNVWREKGRGSQSSSGSGQNTKTVAPTTPVATQVRRRRKSARRARANADAVAAFLPPSRNSPPSVTSEATSRAIEQTRQVRLSAEVPHDRARKGSRLKRMFRKLLRKKQRQQSGTSGESE